MACHDRWRPNAIQGIQQVEGANFGAHHLQGTDQGWMITYGDQK